MNGASPGANNAEKAEREKAKKKEKKERKDKERAERVEREKGEKDDTPRSASTPVLPESASMQENPNVQRAEEVKSPVTTDGGGSTGVRTPKTGRPPRNPWTIFMRMQVTVTELELRDFFGEAKGGVRHVSLSHWN
jgi:hypothetical protein